MRCNIYAEEQTQLVSLVRKGEFTGIRFWLYLPVTVKGKDGKPRQVRGPFKHHPGDDDSSAVTFWGKRDLRGMLRKALALLDALYAKRKARA